MQLKTTTFFLNSVFARALDFDPHLVTVSNLWSVHAHHEQLIQDFTASLESGHLYQEDHP